MSGQVQKRNAQMVELLKSEFVSSNNASFITLHLPHTTSATTGIIWKNGHYWMHDFSTAGAGQNIFLGEDVGNFTMAVTAVDNVGVGYHVLDALTTGHENIAVGTDALGATITGIGNVAVGYQALFTNTHGDTNVAVGKEALYTSTGHDCVAIGGQSLYHNTTGASNVAIGYNALHANTTGFSNVAVGDGALDSNIDGFNNVAVGDGTLEGNTTGDYNAAVGFEALGDVTTGGTNAAIGYRAGRYHADGITALTDPEDSVYIGALCRGFNNTDNNSIVIGYLAIGLGPNTAVLGNTSITITSLWGKVGVETPAPLAQMHVDQSAAAGAIPVLALDQADDSDGFINYIGNTAASAVGPISSWTVGNAIQGFVRVEINGAQFWMPYYDAPTA